MQKSRSRSKKLFAGAVPSPESAMKVANNFVNNLSTLTDTLTNVRHNSGSSKLGRKSRTGSAKRGSKDSMGNNSAASSVASIMTRTLISHNKESKS